ncbi:MAG: prolipoprotein diacylglyceryl transferase [Dehalococcoidia bacterium]
MALDLLAITISIDPVAFTLGPLSVRWYGLMYVAGILAAVLVLRRLAPRLGARVDELWDLAVLAIPAGLLGGRLYYVAQNRPGYYLDHPAEVFAVWEGGMAFFGAIIAVAAVTIAFARWRHISVWPLLDAMAVAALVGQPFGRLGNVINGDVIGYETTVPWATRYVHERAFVPELGVPYHPAAAYAILANLLLLGFLVVLLRRKTVPGAIFALYLVGYSITQFIVFFWRDNTVTLLGLKQAQLSAIVVALVGAALLYAVTRHRNGPEALPRAR